MFRILGLCGVMAASVLLAVPAWAGDWQPIAFVSSTLGNDTGRLCVGAPDVNRPSDFGCPTYAPTVNSGGLLTATTLSATTINAYYLSTTTAYLGTASIPSLGAGAVAANSVSVTGALNSRYLSSTDGFIGTATGGTSSFTTVNSRIASFTTLYTGTASATVANVGSLTASGIVTATFFEGNGSRLTGITAAATAASSTGAVQFNVANALAGDGANLFWDDTNNRLGIGTTSPQAVLDVAASTTSASIRVGNLMLQSYATDNEFITQNLFFNGSWRYAANGYGVRQYFQSGGYYLDTAPSNASGVGAAATVTNRFFVGNTGNVGIGTSAPDAKLDVNGRIVGGFGAESTGGTLDWNDASNARAGSGYSLLYRNATNGPGGSGIYYHPFSFEYLTKNGTGPLTQFAIPYGYTSGIANSMPMYIRGRYSGTWTSWFQFTMATVSDYRLKKNVQTLSSGGLDAVMKMRPIRYSYVDEKGAKTTREGFIAHEMQAIAPYAVTGKKDEVDVSGKPLYQSMNYGEITPFLTAAIQELKAANDNLVSDTTTLRQQLKAANDILKSQLKAANDNLQTQLKAANDNNAAEMKALRNELDELKKALRR